MQKISAISRVLAFLLVVCLCSAFVPVMTFAADAPGTVTIKTSDAEYTITADNTADPLEVGGGTVTYDTATNTVTLDGVSVMQILLTNADFTLNLVGDNVIDKVNGAGNALHAGKNLTVVGSGTLTANRPIYVEAGVYTQMGATVNATATNASPLKASAGIELLGGKVIANVTAAQNAIYSASGRIYINGAYVEAYASGGHAIRSAGGPKTVLIEGNEYDPETGTGTYVHARGASFGLSGQTSVTVNGGTVLLERTANSAYGLVDGPYTQTGGSVTVQSNSHTMNKIAGGAFVNITGGRLHFEGGNVAFDSATVSLNGTVTGTVGNLIGTTVTSLTIGADAKFDLATTNGAYTESETLAITDNATWVEGCELTADATYLKTQEKAPVTADAIINATVAGKDASVQLLGEGVDETKVSENNAVSFTVAGLTEGTYNYTLQIIDADANGWTYDKSVQDVTVVVDAEGNVTVTEGIIFTNTYAAAGTSATINVNVNVDGKDFNADDFTLLVNGVETAIVDGKATLTYNYDAETVQTYNFELVSKNNGITVAEATKSVTVTVTDDKNGSLVATGAEDVTFDATYKAASTSASFDVTVNLEGKELEGDEFHLVVNGVKHYVFAGGKETFDYTYDEVGVYTYEVSLVLAQFNAGITKDTDVEIVTVTVTDNGEGQLVATVENANPVFDNTYKAVPGATNIKAQVNLTGRDLVSGEINLVLTGGNIDGEQIVTVDETGAVNIPLTFTEAGTYTFTLAQTCASNGVTLADAQTFEVIAYESNGAIIAMALNNSFTFNNTYDYVVDTEVTVNVKVSVSDYTLKEGDVTATLTKGEDIIATATVDVDGNVTFTIPADKNMGGTYTVTLTANVKGITLSEAQTVTVEVTDDGDGVANVTATATDLIFKGTYRVPFAEGEIVNGKYVVTETGKATEMGLIKIGADYYYAGPNGVLVTGKYYAWRLNENCDIEKGWYYFDKTGKLVITGIVDGYYYENGKPTEKGLFLYDGDYYVAQYDGKIITGKYYVWKIDDSAKEAYVEGWYEFDENGVIVPLKNGIVDGKYYVDGKPTEMGLFEYEGDLYVAQYDGKIITGKYYVWKVQEGLEDLNGAWRYFGNDGKLLQGIVDGYYYVNGVRTEMGLFKYTDNNYYVAQYDGKIITSENYTKHGAGKYYVWKIHESANDKKAGWYFFDAKGRMIQWFNDKVYSIEFANTPATYESATNNTAWNAQNHPNTYGGSFAFDGWNYVAFSEDVITSGLTTVPVYAHNDTDATAKARTIFAVESTEWVDYKLHYVCSGADVDWMAKDGAYTRIQIGDTWYTVGVYTYEGTVEAGENTWLSMYQFYMDKTAEATDGNYQILFLNQLVGENEEFAAVDAEYAKIVFNADYSEETPKP